MNISKKIALLTREIMEKAEDEAENIIIEAENKAEKILKDSRQKKLSEHREILRENIESLKRKKLNMLADAEFQLRRDFLNLRKKFVDMVIAETENILLNMHERETEKYMGILEKFMLEGIDIIDEDSVEIVLPIECKNKESEIKEILREKRATVNTKISLGTHHTGPVIKSNDGKRLVDYSLKELIRINEELFIYLVDERLGEIYGKN